MDVEKTVYRTDCVGAPASRRMRSSLYFVPIVCSWVSPSTCLRVSKAFSPTGTAALYLSCRYLNGEVLKFSQKHPSDQETSIVCANGTRSEISSVCTDGHCILQGGAYAPRGQTHHRQTPHIEPTYKHTKYIPRKVIYICTFSKLVDPQQRRPVVEANCEIGMILSQRFPGNRNSSKVERVGLNVFALRIEQLQ